MFNGIMLDLETMGTRPGSAIVAVGAVKFDAGGLGDEFYRAVDLQSCLDAGLTVSGATVEWWLKQNARAKADLFKDPRPLEHVLQDFAGWFGPRNTPLWGNGAAFDNALLAEVYARCGLRPPWEFWFDRCYRTVRSLSSVAPSPREGTHHNALDDAKYQALHLIKIAEVMKTK